LLSKAGCILLPLSQESRLFASREIGKILNVSFWVRDLVEVLCGATIQAPHGLSSLSWTPSGIVPQQARVTSATSSFFKRAGPSTSGTSPGIPPQGIVLPRPIVTSTVL